MNIPWRSFRRFATSRSGATAVEFAIVCLPLFLVSLGIVEFGRALFVRNDLAYVADVAARKVLIGQLPVSSSAAEIAAGLESTVRAAFDGDPDLLQVTVSGETINGIQFHVLSIRYPFTFLIPGLRDSPFALSVMRRIPVS